MLMLIITAVLVASTQLSLFGKLPDPIDKKPLIWSFGDSTFQFCSRLRIEGFYGKNTEFLNNADSWIDQTIIPARHTLDFNGKYELGTELYGYPLIRIKATVRSKNNWGDPESNAATDRSRIDLAGAHVGEHFHSLNRAFPWIREFWIESSINDMFNLNFVNTHFVTGGYFPFELGRGISLGSAFAMDPDFLGFYSPNAVDQYAPGFKFSGPLDHEAHVIYDLYAAILVNRSDLLANVRRKIFGQEYGRRCTPQRGFGKINWLAAGRIQWHAYQGGTGDDVLIEPYALFLDQREQFVEFLGDANTKLGTFGIAFDAVFCGFEWGFEFAQNMGRQEVKGWDRNLVTIGARDGALVKENTQVSAVATVAPDTAGKRALAIPSNQSVINTSIEDQTQNGKQISTNLVNSDIRFRNPYVNTFCGYMAVWDMLYKFCDGCSIAGTLGLATGDRNPNRDFNAFNDSQRDTDFRGFISLQEQYSGKRVNSAFLMSGAGKIPRILSFPARNLSDPFPDKTSQFSNLIFGGFGFNALLNSWNINPNIISYWQETPTRLPETERFAERFASPWLGTEFNLFADICLDTSMKLYGVASVFVPGTHYSDLQGIPINRAQREFLEGLQSPGTRTLEQVPLLGTNAAFSLNVGVEYRF